MNLDQEKRVMLAFALSIVMLVLYRVYVVKEPPPQTKKATPVATAPVTPPAPSAAPTKPVAPTKLPVLQGTQEETLVVENNLYTIRFSTRGALVKSWVLKQYRDAKDQPLDLVDAPACESLGFPMSLSLPNSDLTEQVNGAIYVAKTSHGRAAPAGEETEVHAGATLTPPVTLSFTYSNGKVQVKKRFSFGADYVVNVSVSVVDRDHELPPEVAWPGGFGDQTLTPAAIATYRQGVYGFAGSVSKVSQGKVKEPRVVPGPLQLVGLEDKFFAGIFLPDSPDQVALRLARQDWAPPDWTEKDRPNPLETTLVGTQPKPLDFRLFVGPKALDVLKSVNPPLDSLVDFGWFSIVAKPLFMALRYINDHWVHNYGWAIVILTLLITAAMFPLRLKGLRSAQEMQKIQPIIKGIQDKYKNYKFNDPRKQKMNEEVMKVYSEHGINPLGGCLPMLVQLPFLYGFYRVLDLAIELRHAPWIGWIHDLSAPDRLMVMGIPIPVLVILMTVASFFLQRMTPTPSVDPSQQRMMMLMPVFFAFMFYRLASGMVLYWLTSSVAQLVQQVFINRRMPPPTPLPVPRKLAESKG